MLAKILSDLIKFRKTLLALTFALSVTACIPVPPTGKNGELRSSPDLSPSKKTYPLSRFSDIPIPSKFEYDRSKSLIYESGSGTIKVGRLFFSGWAKQNRVISFFQNEMLNNGWTLVRVIEHDGTMLLYEKETRVCTINITSTLGQSSVEIQIGPK